MKTRGKDKNKDSQKHFFHYLDDDATNRRFFANHLKSMAIRKKGEKLWSRVELESNQFSHETFAKEWVDTTKKARQPLAILLDENLDSKETTYKHGSDVAPELRRRGVQVPIMSYSNNSDYADPTLKLTELNKGSISGLPNFNFAFQKGNHKQYAEAGSTTTGILIKEVLAVCKLLLPEYDVEIQPILKNPRPPTLKRATSSPATHTLKVLPKEATLTSPASASSEQPLAFTPSTPPLPSIIEAKPKPMLIRAVSSPVKLHPSGGVSGEEKSIPKSPCSPFSPSYFSTNLSLFDSMSLVQSTPPSSGGSISGTPIPPTPPTSPASPSVTSPFTIRSTSSPVKNGLFTRKNKQPPIDTILSPQNGVDTPVTPSSKKATL